MAQGDSNIYGEGLLNFFKAYTASAAEKRQQDIQEQALARQLAGQSAEQARVDRKMSQEAESEKSKQARGAYEFGETMGLKREELAQQAKLKYAEIAGKSAEKTTESKKLTEGQRAAAGFATRAKTAAGQLEEMEKEGRATSGPGAFKSSAMGLIGMVSPVAARGLLSDDEVAVDQARRNFVSAVLRPESGAAIPEAELASETIKYFPAPGDTPEVLAMKKLAREQAIAGQEAKAGDQGLADVQQRLPQQQAVQPSQKLSPQQREFILQRLNSTQVRK